MSNKSYVWTLNFLDTFTRIIYWKRTFMLVHNNPEIGGFFSRPLRQAEVAKLLVQYGCPIKKTLPVEDRTLLKICF